MTAPLLLALALVAAPGRATASDDPPRTDEAVIALLQRADAAFAEGRLLDAWDAIDEAEALRPGPFYDYMRGLIRQAQGRCDLAVEHWARFLDSEPSGSDAAEVRVLIDECGGLPEPTTPEPPAEPEPEPSLGDGEPTTGDPREPDAHAPTTEAPADAEPRPWHRDPAGGVLLGVGALCLAGAGATALASNRLHAGAPDTQSLMVHDTRLTQARALGVVAIASGVVGLGLVVGATIRYARVGRRSRGLSRLGPGLTLRF